VTPQQQISCSIGAEYCYAFAETGFYLGPGSIQLGCNPLPVDCRERPTCDCLLAHFAAGFCVCAVIGGGLTVQCSFA
jgi:hypothetical protein